MSDLPKTRAAGVLIFRHEPKMSFLLMKHPTRWDLPKGHVDPGETDLQCALREMEEETGIHEDQIAIEKGFEYKLSYLVNYKKKFGGSQAMKTVVYYLAWLQEDVKLQLTEHDGYQWTDWAPPHRIQEETIDGLLSAAEAWFRDK